MTAWIPKVAGPVPTTIGAPARTVSAAAVNAGARTEAAAAAGAGVAAGLAAARKPAPDWEAPDASAGEADAPAPCTPPEEPAKWPWVLGFWLPFPGCTAGGPCDLGGWAAEALIGPAAKKAHARKAARKLLTIAVLLKR